jgi:hypothetical protein
MPLKTFEQFAKERQYITNVSESTVKWYWSSWKAWGKYQPDFIINARLAGVLCEKTLQDILFVF